MGRSINYRKDMENGEYKLWNGAQIYYVLEVYEAL